MKKLLAMLLATVLAGTMLSGCRGNTNAPTAIVPAASGSAGATTTDAVGGEPELSGSIVWATNHTDLADTILADFAAEFMALHPGTEVEVEGLKDTEQAMMTRMATNKMPDVSLVINTKISSADYPTYFLQIVKSSAT